MLPRFLAAAVLLGATAVLPATAASAASPKATSSKALPITTADEIVVDAKHQHLVISDQTHGKLLVTDYTGATVSLLDAPSTAGLLIEGDRLYVAEPAASAIVAYDTTTLKPAMTYALGVQPGRLAWTAGKLWFSYGSGDLGSLDLAASEAVFYTAEQGNWTSISDLRTTAGAPGRLLIAGASGGTNDVAVVDVSGATPDVTAERSFTNRLDLRVALTPDGRGVVVLPRDWSATPGLMLRAADLTDAGPSYQVGLLPSGVAVASDGTVVVGDSSRLAYFPTAGTVRPVDTYNGPLSVEVLGHFALEPGGDRAFGLVNTSSGLTLQVFNAPPKATLRGSIHVERNPVLPGSTYQVEVAFTGADSAERATGRPVQIVRSDGKRVGPTTIPDGVFQFSDTAPATVGPLTYTATIPADADTNAFMASITVQVAGAQPTTLTLDHNGAYYNYGTTVAFTSKLSRPAYAPFVFYADPAGPEPKRALSSHSINGDGRMTASLRLTRNTVVAVIFPGDAYNKPASKWVVVYTRASVATAISKQYKTKGAYAVFHQKTNPVFTTTMTAYPKRKQYLVVEAYSGGRWRTVKSGYYTLTSAGKSSVTFAGSRKTGTNYRVRSAYLTGKSGDTVNATSYSAYRYFTFTK